jgi:hypothetical protein
VTLAEESESAHNGAVNYYQPTTACPRCGSTADVHAISELADMARMQLGQAPQSYPGAQQGAVPGWAQQPTTGPIPDPYQGQGGYRPDFSSGIGRSIGDDVAGPVVSEAFRFIGRRVGRRMQQTAAQAQSSLAARNQEMLMTQIAIADKYPELRACLSDSVVFLAGGQSVLPMPNLQTLTMQQADGIVAALRNG